MDIREEYLKLEDDKEKALFVLENKLISIKDYATQSGFSYENARRKIVKLEDDPNLSEHIFLIKKSTDRKPVKYIDKTVVDYLKASQRSEPVVVYSDEQKVQSLENDNQRLKDTLSRVLREKDAYAQKIIELQEHPESVLDMTKYMLLEDHEKIQKELEEKSEQIKSLEEDKKKLIETSEKQESLNKELEMEKQKVISEKSKLETDVVRITSEKEKIELAATHEKERLESDIERMTSERDRVVEEARAEKVRMEEEYEAALRLGFFARRRKLKELEARKKEK